MLTRSGSCFEKDVMRFDVMTLFPEWFGPFRSAGVSRRAFGLGLLELHCWNPRDWAQGAYRRVDDRPFGGGPGMVMMAEPLWRCLQAIRAQRGDQAPVVLFSPAGRRLDHAAAVRWSACEEGAILICGRYEGVDQRFIDACVDEQISLGDFVLSGGEIAALALLDSAVRLLPGVLHTADSHLEDSFNPDLDGLLDSPHYTRPVGWEGPSGLMRAPEVLQCGHHGQIAAYRRQESLRLTARERPDLLEQARAQKRLSAADEAFLDRLLFEEEQRPEGVSG